jgi:hypothetical protein
MPATIDTRKKISAHLRIVIGPFPSLVLATTVDQHEGSRF